jgi:hypothetical protein
MNNNFKKVEQTLKNLDKMIYLFEVEDTLCQDEFRININDCKQLLEDYKKSLKYSIDFVATHKDSLSLK